MADVHSKLDELTKTVEGAKSVPLSASCVVHRTELLAALDEVRQLLPTELAAAGDLLRDKQDVVAEGRAEAARILADATAERDRLVDDSEVVREAARRADEIVTTAATQAVTMRREVENYVDGKLANFEVVLQKTVAAVSRGREKLRGSVDDLSDGEPILSEVGDVVAIPGD
jgi:ABC-type transporter Mla subunit MlaD